MKHSIIRFRPSLVQEQHIIKTVVDWTSSKVNSGGSIEPKLVQLLTRDCDFQAGTFCVTFRGLFNVVLSELNTLDWTSDTQQEAFDVSALHHFLCRTIGTQNVYKRESAHRRRRSYFDRCVQKTKTIAVPAVPAKPVVAVVTNKAEQSIQNEIFTFLVNSKPELVAEFVRVNAEDFIKFCINK